MAGKKICFSDTELAQMFSDYVNRMQARNGTPRRPVRK